MRFAVICPKLTRMITYSYPASVAYLTKLAALVASMPPGVAAGLTLDGDKVLLRIGSGECSQTVDEKDASEDQRGDEGERVVAAQQPLLGVRRQKARQDRAEGAG
jgi:hypothetical protein